MIEKKDHIAKCSHCGHWNDLGYYSEKIENFFYCRQCGQQLKVHLSLAEQISNLPADPRNRDYTWIAYLVGFLTMIIILVFVLLHVKLGGR
jgi:uncharacterized membrane protein YvbJ